MFDRILTPLISEGNNDSGSSAPVQSPRNTVDTTSLIFFLLFILIFLVLSIFSCCRRGRVQDEVKVDAKQQRREWIDYVHKNLHKRAWQNSDIETGDTTKDTVDKDGDDDTISINLDQECAICMVSFKSGDPVCESSNTDKCKHIYHYECMLAWLHKHKDCPMCRQEYLNSGSNDKKDVR